MSIKPHKLMRDIERFNKRVNDVLVNVMVSPAMLLPYNLVQLWELRRWGKKIEQALEKYPAIAQDPEHFEKIKNFKAGIANVREHLTL